MYKYEEVVEAANKSFASCDNIEEILTASAIANMSIRDYLFIFTPFEFDCFKHLKSIEKHYEFNSEHFLVKKENKIDNITSVPQWGNDGNKELPNYGGLYLIGNTVFNPITMEEYYWVKVGQSNDVGKRALQYRTQNPMVWCIDSKEVNSLGRRDAELECHNKLSAIATNRAISSVEWFSVSREDYLDICDMGFDWFDIK